MVSRGRLLCYKLNLKLKRVPRVELALILDYAVVRISRGASSTAANLYQKELPWDGILSKGVKSLSAI